MLLFDLVDYSVKAKITEEFLKLIGKPIFFSFGQDVAILDRILIEIHTNRRVVFSVCATKGCLSLSLFFSHILHHFRPTQNTFSLSLFPSLQCRRDIHK
jgi:hypothetical protein